MTFNTTQFKDVFANWPAGVSVVTCTGTDGKPHGFTASSVISVSLEPPLVLFALKRTARSMSHFLEATSCAINMLRKDQQELSTRFSTPHPDRFGDLGYVAGAQTGAPLLDGAWGKLECTMHAQYDGGDHVLFVGRIVAIEYEGGDPLVYHRRGYRTLVDSDSEEA